MKKISKKTLRELEKISFDLSCISPRISQIIHGFPRAKVRRDLRKVELDCMGHAAYLSRVAMLGV